MGRSCGPHCASGREYARSASSEEKIVVKEKVHFADVDPALTAALHAYNNDVRLLRAAVVAAGGVLILPWTGSVPARSGEATVPAVFNGPITVRLEDLPDDAGDTGGS